MFIGDIPFQSILNGAVQSGLRKRLLNTSKSTTLPNDCKGVRPRILFSAFLRLLHRDQRECQYRYDGDAAAQNEKWLLWWMVPGYFRCVAMRASYGTFAP
jgi:hypothetical protein